MTTNTAKYYTVNQFGDEVDSNESLVIPGELVRTSQQTGMTIPVLCGDGREAYPTDLAKYIFPDLSKVQTEEDQQIFDSFMNGDLTIDMQSSKSVQIFELVVHHIVHRYAQYQDLNFSMGSVAVLDSLARDHHRPFFPCLKNAEFCNQVVLMSLNPSQTWLCFDILKELYGFKIVDMDKPEDGKVFEAYGFMSDLFSDIVSTLTDFFSRTCNVFLDLYNLVRDVIVSILPTSFLGEDSFLSNVRNFIDKHIRSFVNFLWSLMNPFSHVMTSLQKAQVFTIFIVVTAASMGFFSAKLIFDFLHVPLDLYINPVQTFHSYSAQTTSIEASVGLVTVLFDYFLGPLFGTRQRNYERNLREYLNIFSFGTLAARGIHSVCDLLWITFPVNLKFYLTEKFGSVEQRNLALYDEWESTAVVLTRIQIPSVIACPLYRTTLNTCINDYKQIEPPTDKKIYAQTLYASLMNRLGSIERHESGSVRRNVPYSLHLFGKPGVGKSTILTSLVRDVFSFEQIDIYTKTHEEFWSGYVDQQVVFFDEFLAIGETQALQRVGGEYLDLISCSRFSPSFADIKPNIVVGTKGTEVRPDVVITANNVGWNTIEGINVQAFQRRRNHVIEITLNDDVPLEKDGATVKLDELTDEELKDKTHLRFRILPNTWNSVRESGGIENFPKVTYDGLVEELRVSYNKFVKVREAMNKVGSVDTERQKQMDPTNVLMAALAKKKNIPMDEVSYDTVLLEELKNVTVQNKNHDNYFDSRSDQKHILDPENNLSVEERVKQAKMLLDTKSYNDRVHVYQDIAEQIHPNVLDQIPSLNEFSEEYLSRGPPTTDGWTNVLCQTAVSSLPWITVVCGLYALKTFKQWLRPEEKFQACSVNEYRNRKEKPVYRPAKIDNRYEYYSDGGEPKEVLSFSFSETTTGEYRTAIGYGVPWKGNKFITNAHYFYCTKRDSPCRWMALGTPGFINYRGQSYGVELVGCQGKHNLTNDTVIVEIKGKTLPLFPDLKNRFIKQEDFDVTGSDFHGSIVYPDKSTKYCMASVFPAGAEYQYTVPWGHKDQVTTIKMNHPIVSSVPTEQGDCGVPLVLQYGANGRKIAGILCAGRTLSSVHQTLFMPLTLEEIIELDTCEYVRESGKPQNGRRHKVSLPTLNTLMTPYFMNALPAKTDSKLTDDLNKLLCPHLDVQKMTSEEFFLQKDLFNQSTLVELSKELQQKGYFQLADFVMNFIEDGMLDGKERQFVACSQNEVQVPLNTKEPAGTFGPNLLHLSVVPPSERVHLNRTTKIRKSGINSFLPEQFQSQKQPPVTRPVLRDGVLVDPIINKIREVSNVTHVEVDEDIIEQVCEDLFDQMSHALADSQVKRMLTMEEAVGGIPGYMKGMTLSTSPGYPLCKENCSEGKRHWIEKDQDTVIFKNNFAEMVDQTEQKILCGKPIEPHRWIGHFKDETVSPEKIESVRTRVIYCGDLVRQTIYRKYLGALLAAINNHPLYGTSSAIGLNQYSIDMDRIYKYLTDFKHTEQLLFQAGDYKDFDMRHHPSFTKHAYRLIRRLNFFPIPETIWTDFVHSDTASPMQIGDKLAWFSSYHPSGCLFTSIKNNIQNSLYFRYIFKKLNPNLIFDDCVRAIFLGDDHILCMNDDYGFTGPVIQRELSKIGQIYTSDKKGEEIREYQKWEELTFLGAIPKYNSQLGMWVGAPKISTIASCLSYTHDNDATLRDRIEQCLDLMSLHERSLFFEIYEPLNRGLKSLTGRGTEAVTYNQRRNRTSMRTAKEDPSFYAYSKNDTIRDLTTFHTTQQQHVVIDRHVTHENKTIGEEKMSLEYTLDSHIYRGSFDWADTSGAGTIIGQFLAPYGILSGGNQSNIQNMSFERFIYWHGDVELTLQINGTPFLQGMLVLFFYPLGVIPTDYTSQQWFGLPHVILNPHTASTVSLRVPFQYPRSVLNNFAGFDQGVASENLGSFGVGVLSPLKGVDTVTLPVTVYSSFPNSKLTIPRPVGTSTTTRRRQNETAQWLAYGQGGSTMTTNNTYNISDVVGNIPLEITDSQHGNTQNISPELSIPLPMDNPILASGAAPIVGQFPGMSKSNGVVPSQNLALHPKRMNRTHLDMFGTDAMDIHKILAMPAYLESFTWDTTQPVGYQMLYYKLNSVLGFPLNSTVPFNIAILNLFKFWRADIRFDLYVVKTKFQTGRLRATVAYGAPVPIPTTDYNQYYNQVLDFVENEKVSFTVPYNQATEYLRTWEGDTVVDPIQDYSMGSLVISVANALRAADSVSQSVEILSFVSFHNVSLAVPATVPNFDPSYQSSTASIVFGSSQTIVPASLLAVPEPEFNAYSGAEEDQGLTAPPMLGEEQAEVGVGESNQVAITQVTAVKQPPPCRVVVNEKFEYVVRNLAELFRRLHVIPQPKTQPGENKWITVRNVTNVSPLTGSTIFEIMNTPCDLMRCFFAGWGGSLRYRIYCTTGLKDLYYIPSTTKVPPGTTTNIRMANQVNIPPLTKETALGYDAILDENTTSLKSTEFLFPTGEANYVDINVPFDTAFYYHLTNLDDDFSNLTGYATGYVDVFTDDSAYVAQAFGDDFSYGIFRPPARIILTPYVAPLTVPTGTALDVAGFKLLPV